MPVGKIEKWVSERGFGFVTNDLDGGNMFVHAKQLEKAGIYDARVGDVLEYAIGVHNGREEAVSVARIAGAGE